MNYYVDIFFRLCNFGALCGLMVYGFKKYVLPSLQTQLASDDAHEEALLSRQSVLESNHRELDQHIVHEKHLCAELQEKIVQWSNVIKKELHERQEHKKEIVALLSTDQALQQERKQEQKLLDEVLQSAITQSRQELIARFSDKDEQEKYMQSIIDFMQEHSS